MKSKAKTKPSSMPEGKEEDNLYPGAGKRTASYSRKRVKGRLTSSEASHLQTSRSDQNSHSGNVESKANSRATATNCSSEKEQMVTSATAKISFAKGDEKVAESKVTKSSMVNKSQMESNVEEQSGIENTMFVDKSQSNPTTQSNRPCNAEFPSPVSEGSHGHALGSSAFKDVERVENSQHVESKGTSLVQHSASGGLDRENSILIQDSECSKEGLGNFDSLVSSKATDVDMPTEIGDDIQANGAIITSGMKEEIKSDTEDSTESQDVKVCDICGDAGQEEMLAICSRCTDGAEHTYCMEVRLDDLPEGDWLCEGCILKEETENQLQEKSEAEDKIVNEPCSTENQLQEKSEAEDKIVNEPCSTENSQCNGQTLSSKVSPAETNGTTPVVAGNMKELLSTAMSTLRKLKKLDTSSLSREKTIEASCKPTTATLLGSVAEEKSTNESDMIKPEPIQLATSCDKSENIIGQQHPICSDSSKIQSFIDSRGTLSKSFSFNNSKVPKVKPLMEDFPQMQKTIKEPNLVNSQKGFMRTTTKTASFKNMDNHISGNNPEIASKMQSNIAQWPQARISKQMKEINTVDKKNSSLVDVARVGPVPCVGISSKDTKSVFDDEKLKKSSDSNHFGTKVGLTGSNSLAPDEAKQTSFSTFMNEGNKSNKWKDAVELARTQRNSEVPCQSVEPSASKTDKNSDASAKQFSSAVSSFPLKMPTKEVSAHAQICMGSPCTDPFTTAANNHAQQKGTDGKIPSSAPAKGIRNTVLNVVDKWNIKPNLQISTEQASFLSQPFQASIIPELEYVWQGTFQVLRTGKHPRTHDGFQAHLSTVVSTKAIEVANMFPCKLQLEEVPRQSSWPLHFKENSPKEDNIALFFFAKDMSSYKYHYQKLLENMLKNDLALRGNINAVELLIFPSNILPKGYQQWNKMIFLWGIFREKINCTRDLDINMKPTLMQSNVTNVKDLSSHSAVHAGISHNTTRDSTLQGRLLKEFENDSSSSTDVQDISSSRTGNVGINELKESHFQTEVLHQNVVAEKVPAEQKLHLLPTSCSSENTSNPPNFSTHRTGPKIYIDIEQLPMEVEDDPKNLDNLGELDTKGQACSSDVSADSKITEQKIIHENAYLESATVSANELSRNLVDTENISWKSRLNQKRAYSSLGETTTSVGQVSKAYGETGLPIDDKDSKKIKVENGKHSSNLSVENIPSNKEFSGTRPSMPTLMDSNPICAGKFPDSSGNFESSLSNKDSLDSNIPDLELVLGGNKRLAKQVNMLMSAPKRSKEGNQDKLLAAPVNDLDDESGSLALSLAFPDSGRMKMDKPKAQAKQSFPDKPHVS